MNGGHWAQLCFSHLLRWNAVSVSKCWIKLITYCEQKTEQKFHFNLSKQFFHESLDWEEEWGKFTDTHAQHLKKISLTAVCFQGCTVLFLAVCAYVRSPFFIIKAWHVCVFSFSHSDLTTFHQSTWVPPVNSFFAFRSSRFTLLLLCVLSTTESQLIPPCEVHFICGLEPARSLGIYHLFHLPFQLYYWFFFSL